MRRLPKLLAGSILITAVLFLSGCIYEAPLSEKPTRGIDRHLVGDWVTKEDGKEAHMIVTRLNDTQYIVHYSKDVFLAFHSDIGPLRLVSVQNITPLKDSDRKYVFFSYELQDGGKKLVLRSVNEKTIPDTLRTTAQLQEAISRNAKNPDLFNAEAGTFTKVKPATSIWK